MQFMDCIHVFDTESFLLRQLFVYIISILSCELDVNLAYTPRRISSRDNLYVLYLILSHLWNYFGTLCVERRECNIVCKCARRQASKQIQIPVLFPDEHNFIKSCWSLIASKYSTYTWNILHRLKQCKIWIHLFAN